MARPRVFVSSTYYDLKHVRSSLDNFIESLGFDSVLSEKGDIAYSPDAALDESCYREATAADVFVLVIGGRYGSAASAEDDKPSPAFFERYESITKKEYDAACSRDIPIYILIEQNVYSEYQTFLRNRDNQDIQYAHVDSINVFELIQEILAKTRNNPVHTFERFSDIEGWLREQWAGLFRELLQKMSNQMQMTTLSSQVEALAAINETLQAYLEAIVAKVSPDDAGDLIESQRKRLIEFEQTERLKQNDFYCMGLNSVPDIHHFAEALSKAKSFQEFAELLGQLTENPEIVKDILRHHEIIPIDDLNEARKILNKPPFPYPEEASKRTQPFSGPRRRRR